MKVILLEDIDKIGKKYDTKEVADGYARNFLIPKKLVKPATKEMEEWAKLQKEVLEKKAEEELKKAQGLASLLDGQEVMITMKIGPEGQLFESVTAQKIAEKLKEMGFEVKKNQIDLAEPIKEVGEYPIKVKFDHNLETQVQVIISGQEPEGKEKDEEE
jgi:large subunit ribosomal protein L9